MLILKGTFGFVTEGWCFFVSDSTFYSLFDYTCFCFGTYFWISLTMRVFWYCSSPRDQWNDSPKIWWLVIKAGVSKGLFLPNSCNWDFGRNTNEPENWQYFNAIGLRLGSFPTHLVELVLISYACMSWAYS